MNNSSNTTKTKIIKITEDQLNQLEDCIVKEALALIYLNNKKIADFVCSPSYLEELAVGFLCSSGLLDKSIDLNKVIVHKSKQEFIFEIHAHTNNIESNSLKCCISISQNKSKLFIDKIDKDCFASKINSQLHISANQIKKLTSKLDELSILFKQTGGVHSALLCTPTKTIAFFEDISRHNAVDKVLGYCFLNNIKTNDKILILSGRISLEISIKAVNMNIPILISRSAPTDLAVKTAIKSGLTLVGFARGNRFNIYSNPHRIII
ncbi:formate dehydrogenase accessory sulfurtransferase FdhD [Peptococcaceae bacterium]|nr:formate dehydrogenase accessory sulfurtransferase FdhD [Peptococcaceae bacterium]MCL0063238.1 formate dehydrogenase accessory sulfurtransferase FdhD [Peptococcaceae bacterium]MCL0100927.1 formate dehydrogenase accessory sulfurtransferase FdhD [Peptococcaceae bacterium]